MLFAIFAFTVAVLYVALASRHKKAAVGEINLMGTIALVEEELSPEGAVLARGELWRARLSRDHRKASESIIVKRGNRVRVIGTRGHLLEVEPMK